MPEINIEVTSDAVCPWCFVGKRQLDRALSEMPEVTAHVRFAPFFLDPSVPDGGLDAREYMLAKFGSERVLERLHQRMAAMADEVGIHFDFAAQKRRPNTLDAHRLAHWAEPQGVQLAVVDALFRAYFEQGRDIGDRDTLAAIAAACGMDEDAVRQKLETSDDRDLVREQTRAAVDKHVTGVPCFDIEGLLLPGAQTKDVYQQIIRRMIEKRAPVTRAR